LNALADQGAWIKHSAPYRWPHANAATPTALHTHVQHLHKLFQRRVVWGSDWPHTLFSPHAIPDYATLQPIDPKLLSQAALLYGGE
jgi:predicted TIM-barrel fold metal-dependent hydrolase